MGDYRCHASESEIVAALTGNHRPEHLFALQQNLKLFDIYQRQLTACDAAVEAHLAQLAATSTPPPAPLPAGEQSSRQTTRLPHGSPAVRGRSVAGTRPSGRRYPECGQA